MSFIFFLLYKEQKNRGNWLAYVSLDYQVAPDLNPSAARPKTFWKWNWNNLKQRVWHFPMCDHATISLYVQHNGALVSLTLSDGISMCQFKGFQSNILGNLFITNAAMFKALVCTENGRDVLRLQFKID